MFPYKQIFLVFVTLFFVAGCQKDNDLLRFTLAIVATEDDNETDVIKVNQGSNENETIIAEHIDSVLVFSKTESYRHTSIEKGISTLQLLALENDFVIVSTEDNSLFATEILTSYNLVIFLNTTGDVLNDVQQEAFENYIQSGGSFMGIHSACDTEHDWPWYGTLVGAFYESHPNVQKASITVVEPEHLSTEHLQETWIRTDEWYNFKEINPSIHVLLNLDEETYTGGSNGLEHPIAWYHEFDGGRSFYTGGGHSEASFEEVDFTRHLLGGIKYCLGRE